MPEVLATWVEGRRLWGRELRSRAIIGHAWLRLLGCAAGRDKTLQAAKHAT